MLKRFNLTLHISYQIYFMGDGMKKIVFVIILLCLLTACATQEKYDNKLQALIGQNVSILQKEFGKPSAKHIISPQKQVFTYTKTDDVYIPSEYYLYNEGFEPGSEVIYAPFNGDYDWTPYVDMGYELKYICQTSFIVQNGIITGWAWRGNDCTSY